MAPAWGAVHATWYSHLLALALRANRLRARLPAERLTVGGSLIGGIKETQEMLGELRTAMMGCYAVPVRLRAGCCALLLAPESTTAAPPWAPCRDAADASSPCMASLPLRMNH